MIGLTLGLMDLGPWAGQHVPIRYTAPTDVFLTGVVYNAVTVYNFRWC
jgi:hypothetical protein